MHKSESIRFWWVATHPIQYQAPIMRQLAKEFSFKAIFFAKKGNNQGGVEPGFKEDYAWDVDLLEGYSSEVLQSNKGTGLKMLKVVIQKLRIEQPHFVLVNGWFPRQYLVVWLACFLTHTPFGIRGDSFWEMNSSILKKGFKQLLFPILFFFPKVFFYVGKRNKRLYEKMGVNKNRLIFAPHCVDVIPGSTAPRKDLTSQLKFGFIGKHTPKKGLPEFLEVITNWNTPNWQLKIAGDGPLTEALKRKYKNCQKIEWLGFVNQSSLATFYRQIDILVVPSLEMETWGLVCNEAQQFGLPTLTSINVGCSDDLIHSNTGWVFTWKPCNLEMLLEKILEAKENNWLSEEQIRDNERNYGLLRCSESIINYVRKSV